MTLPTMTAIKIGLGAVLIWGLGVKSVIDCIDALRERRGAWALLEAVAAFGSLSIGCAVWAAA